MRGYKKEARTIVNIPHNWLRKGLSWEYDNVHALIAKGASILWPQDLNFADSLWRPKKRYVISYRIKQYKNTYSF